jgi:hypothetical protein
MGMPPLLVAGMVIAGCSAVVKSSSHQVIKSDAFQATFLHKSFERYDGLSSNFQSIFFYLPI